MAHILLVDNDSSMRLTLTMLLKHAKHTLMQAATGADALERIEKNHFDVVLTDLNLDKISGLDILRAAKTTNPQIKVMVLHRLQQRGKRGRGDEIRRDGLSD